MATVKKYEINTKQKDDTNLKSNKHKTVRLEPFEDRKVRKALTDLNQINVVPHNKQNVSKVTTEKRASSVANLDEFIQPIAAFAKKRVAEKNKANKKRTSPESNSEPEQTNKNVTPVRKKFNTQDPQKSLLENDVFLKHFHDKLLKENKYFQLKPSDKCVKYDKRNETLELLVQLQEKYELPKDAYFKAVSIFDYVLYSKHVSSSKYEILAITAMFIAAKHESSSSPDRFHIKKIVKILNRKIPKERVEQNSVQPFQEASVNAIEFEILKRIGFELIIPTPLLFANEYLKYFKIEAIHKVYQLSEYILEKFTLAKIYSNVTPNLTALTALYIAVQSIEPTSLNSLSNLIEIFHENFYFNESLLNFYCEAEQFLSNDVFVKYSRKNKMRIDELTYL